MASQQDRILAAALSRLEKLERSHAFDPINRESRPTSKQQEVIDDFGKYKQYWIRAGNQCQPGDTLVQTPNGPVRLDSLKPGDWVYSEDGNPIQVLKCFDNGVQEVADLTCRGVRWGTSTANHVFQVVTPYGHFVEKRADSFGRDDRVRRVTVKAPLGKVRNSQAYTIGALLGHGCSRQAQKYIQTSSETEYIPNKVAEIVGNTAKKLHESTYTWSVGYANIPYYNDWCKDRYAHEKIVDLEVIKTWDRQSLLEFVAGLIDTDGNVYPSKDHVSLSLGMQAKSIVDIFEYACLALWQIPMNRTIDNRSKYKNGPVHVAYTRNVHFVREILNELEPHLVSPQKKWREEYATLGGKRSSSNAIGLQYGFNRRMVHTYDIHVDSPTNLYLLSNGIVSHNSGKSQTMARILTWVLTDTHPSWKRPPEWGEEPILALVAGRTGKQIEESLLPKIRSYLEPGSYKEIRIGNIIQKLELNNGSRIVFQSLENPNVARERLMSYVAHITWVDELPPTLELVREVLIRTQARNGYSLFSFTPTVVNVEIQQFVDNLKEPEGKVYRFHMLDNPLYSDPKRREELLARYDHLPQHQKDAILAGDWMAAEDQVYYFNYNTMVEMPEGYSSLWRHVESVDPALKSALGLTVWAEKPETGVWYCVMAEYIKGIYVPTELVEAVHSKVKHLNITRRIADPHEVWYIQTAAKMGFHYIGVYKKNDRKSELIKQVQEKLGPVMRLTPGCTDLIQEIQECRYSDRGDNKIVNSSSYHLLDSVQYFADNIPKREQQVIASSWDDWLYQQNDKRKLAIEKAKLRVEKNAIRRGGRRAWR